MDKSTESRLSPPALEEAMEALNQPLPNPTVSLKLFVERCLPLIAANTNGTTNISEWLEVAGNVYLPVDVIDTNGKIVYTVPSLMKPYDTRTDTSKPSIIQIAGMSRLKATQTPVIGSRFFQSHMAGMLDDIDMDSGSLATWNTILTDNGYEPITLHKESELISTNNEVIELADDDFEEMV